jgi:hypothetical protein
MAAASQIVDYRALARDKFPGFSVTGNGCFAVPSTYSTLLVELFAFEIMARHRALELGAKMFVLEPPVPRRKARFRMYEKD